MGPCKLVCSTDEVFEVAEQIERNGIEFYKHAATIVSDNETGDVLLGLARDEGAHEETFADLRARLVEWSVSLASIDAEGVIGGYLRAMADGMVFESLKSEIFTVRENSSPVDILKLAIQHEKDTIVLYTGIRDDMNDGPGREKVETIIREERKHLDMLIGRLLAVGG